MSEIIAIVNQKGGTGKTTTSVNLSAALAGLGKRVLAVDFDPQGNLSYAFGIEEFDLTMSDVLRDDVPLSEVIIEREGLSIVPSDISLADVEVSLINEIGREFFLRDVLEPLDQYDFIIIDCPPSLSLLAVNAMVASECAIVPMQLEVLSLQGLHQIKRTIERINKSYGKELYIKGILPVMVDTRRNLDKEVEEFISENYDIPIFNTHVRKNVRASEAPSFGKSVISYSQKSTSALDYVAFAKELLKGNTK